MKIKPEHLEYMKQAILSNAYAPTLPDYLARGLTEKRWRWDLMYAVNLSGWVCANVYPYANDEHIDTALRSITRDPTLNTQPCLMPLTGHWPHHPRTGGRCADGDGAVHQGEAPHQAHLQLPAALSRGPCLEETEYCAVMEAAMGKSYVTLAQEES